MCLFCVSWVSECESVLISAVFGDEFAVRTMRCFSELLGLEAQVLRVFCFCRCGVDDVA